jgi:hypothetical protein
MLAPSMKALAIVPLLFLILSWLSPNYLGDVARSYTTRLIDVTGLAVRALTTQDNIDTRQQNVNLRAAKLGDMF